ncbi:hypothetical protein M011DRAFT_454895 [Sporormia fimetaria CBS 119925]|uniref:Elongator complex protein 6 n=1 Tax=Sporormia fimetaria CBS 119925 TaxID=1340428 RepID=A0A6A6VN56_9PLEO|nr:hypothetical protein M011DRAFT_454895 [Sporormia fimetaria CBS 119925]
MFSSGAILIFSPRVHLSKKRPKYRQATTQHRCASSGQTTNVKLRVSNLPSTAPATLPAPSHHVPNIFTPTTCTSPLSHFKMTSSARIPSHLAPHIQLPSYPSTTLVTSTLGASANWLIIRFLVSALSSRNTTNEDDSAPPVPLVLVSFLRDWEFWKSEARKAGGLDLERLKREKRFVFVDGLGGMCLGDTQVQNTAQGASSTGRMPGVNGMPSTGLPQRTPQNPTLPARGPPQNTTLPARGPVPNRTIPPRTPQAASPTSPTANTTPTPSPTPPKDTNLLIPTPTLEATRTALETALTSLPTSTRKPLLILDTPSLLLALNPAIIPTALSSTILSLHKHTSHIITHLPADEALVMPSEPAQPLEIANHNFLVKMAHISSRVLSCRVLDTGFAKDVSGVVRITENDIGRSMELKKGGAEEDKRATELLYLVKGDGSVKMFERGAGGDI